MANLNVSAENAANWSKAVEESGKKLADTLISVVEGMNAVTGAIGKLFETLGRQRDNVVHFSEKAGEQLRPMTEAGLRALGKGKAIGVRLAQKGRENPTPVLLGAVAVLGGVALLVYLSRTEKTEAETESIDSAAA